MRGNKILSLVICGAGLLIAACGGGGSGASGVSASNSSHIFLNAVPDQSVTEGMLLQFAVASSPGANGVSFTASGLPDGAEFDTSSLQFRWTPSSSQIGTTVIHFVATDGTITDTLDASIRVIAASGGLAGAKTKTTDGVIMSSGQIQAVTCVAYWSDLQPAETTFDWSSLETCIADAYSYGKKAIASVLVAVDRGIDIQSTPEWVFAKGSPKIRIPGVSNVFPLYWDPVYQQAFSSFLNGLAAQYDGDSRVAFFLTTGYTSNVNVALAGEENTLVQALYESYGTVYDVNGNLITAAQGGDYANAILDILALWAGNFQNTQLAIVNKIASDPVAAEIEQSALAYKMGLLNNGLSTTFGEGPTAQYQRDIAGGINVGWFGVAPNGIPAGETLLSTIQSVVSGLDLRHVYMILDEDYWNNNPDALAWASANIGSAE